MKKQIKSSLILNLADTAVMNMFNAAAGIDPPAFEVSPKNAENAIENAPLFLKVNNVPVSILALEIKKAAIVSLHGIAAELNCNCEFESPLLGLRIIYALNSSHALTFYFQPISFCPISEPINGPGGRIYRRYELCQEGNYYTYTPNALAFQMVTDIGAMTNETGLYRQSNTGLQVWNGTPGAFRNFVDTNDISGDVKSIVMSFEQIEEVYSRTSISGTIKLWNAAGEIATKNFGNLVKHLLLLSSDDVTHTGNDVFPSLKGFSDLSHLCPPSCNGSNFFFILKP